MNKIYYSLNVGRKTWQCAQCGGKIEPKQAHWLVQQITQPDKRLCFGCKFPPPPSDDPLGRYWAAMIIRRTRPYPAFLDDLNT